MTPEKVTEATKFYPTHIRSQIADTWMLCGDVSKKMFQLLKNTSAKLIPTRVSGFRSTSGCAYGVVTHQVGSHQHRFILCLNDPPVRDFLSSISKDKFGFMLGDDNEPDALVIDGPEQSSIFLPLLAMCQECSTEERKEALLEFPFVQEALLNPLQVPSLFEATVVQQVNVSFLLPSIFDETLRSVMRNVVKK